MKKKSVISLLVVLVFVLLNVGVVFANPYAVNGDTWVDASGSNFDQSGQLRLISTSAGTCSAVVGTLLQVDMTQIVQDTVSTATLDVKLNSLGIGGDVTLELFAATADFDETAAGGPLSNWVGSSLGSTVTVSTSNSSGDVITFPSTAAFAAYMEAARVGDGDASVVILISQCPLGASSIDLDEKETGTAAEFSFWNPSAVQLQKVGASNGFTSQNLILVVAIVCLVLVFTGAFIYHRRSRQA